MAWFLGWLFVAFSSPGIRHCPSLWAGTNGGTVYAFSLRVPPTERRMEEAVSASQSKTGLLIFFSAVDLVAE